MNSRYSNAEFICSQYEVIKKDREASDITQTKGRGVFFAIKKNMSFDDYSFDEMQGLESVCIKIQQNKSSLYIYALYIQYRHVNDALADFYKVHLNAILALNSKIDRQDTIIVCGDFNFGNKVNWIENDMGFDYIPLCGESNERKSIIAREFTMSMLDNGLNPSAITLEMYSISYTLTTQSSRGGVES